MKNTLTRSTLATLILLGAVGISGPATAQVAGGTTTTEVTTTESTQLARGWSVKKTLLGKTIYNEEGKKIGKIDDLIISPDKSVSYVIVGAGGFVGIGRHDVAIPVSDIRNEGGKLLMAGVTKDMIKAMPEFTYATDNDRRDRFVEAADKDIALGKKKVAELEKKAGSANADAKVKIDRQLAALRGDVQSAETTLTEMKKATAARWKEFESGVSAATARLRKSVESNAG